MAVLASLASLAPLAAAQSPASPAHSPPARSVVGPRAPASQPYQWEPLTIDGADVLFVDDAPLPLGRAVPAGGPLQHFTSRPGAWYSAAFLPMSPRWPLQVWLWQRARTHDIRMLALDAAPWNAPTVSVPVPLRSAPVGGRRVLLTAPLVLPASSRADGVFLLIEQWSLGGERPGPLWVQARSRIEFEVDERSWWSTRADGTRVPLAPAAPRSPLMAPPDGRPVFELPILQRPTQPAAPESANPR